jgi:oligopeptidase A
MTNALLTKSPFPKFSTLCPDDIEPTIKQLITQNRAAFDHLFSDQSKYSWDSILAPLEEMDDHLSQAWAPVSHLHSVMETEKLRNAYKSCLPLLTEYHTDIMQNENLYKAIQSIAESESYNTLTPAQRKIIENDLRDLRLAGVHLSPEDKVRFGELQKKLSQLSTQFSENILDATHAWTLHITDENALKGLPEQTIKMAEENAHERKLEGWVFTLDYPCYSTVMKYLANRELRWLMYEAYVTRASDQGPHAKRWDNTQIMEDILKTRHELANLLGFNNYAEYSLKTKMAGNPDRVLNFLNELVGKSKKAAQQEIQELTAFAKSLDAIETLEAWDIAYYAEKLQQHKYAI